LLHIAYSERVDLFAISVLYGFSLPNPSKLTVEAVMNEKAEFVTMPTLEGFRMSLSHEG